MERMFLNDPKCPNFWFWTLHGLNDGIAGKWIHNCSGTSASFFFLKTLGRCFWSLWASRSLEEEKQRSCSSSALGDPQKGSAVHLLCDPFPRFFPSPTTIEMFSGKTLLAMRLSGPKYQIHFWVCWCKIAGKGAVCEKHSPTPPLLTLTCQTLAYNVLTPPNRWFICNSWPLLAITVKLLTKSALLLFFSSFLSPFSSHLWL